MATAYLCDFDGTVSPRDVGEAFVNRFSRLGAAERETLLGHWASGELGHRALTVAECKGVSATEAAALAFTRGFALDPGFAPFALERLSCGDAVMVVSEGFDFYVRDLLAREGLGHLPWAANRLRFEAGGVVAEFPFADAACAECGNCKAQHVRRWRERGYRVVLVGDGLSDRCGARVADAVLARRRASGLLEWCRREGIAVRPFEDFMEVAAAARDGLDAPRGGDHAH